MESWPTFSVIDRRDSVLTSLDPWERKFVAIDTFYCDLNSDPYITAERHAMELKDVTPSIFGLVVAYILPGLGSLFSIALFYDPASEMLGAFNRAESTVGLFFFVIVISLLLGMQLTAIRWLVFEKWIYRRIAFRPEEFAALRDEGVANTFRLLIDEAYRYHQFFGAQVFVIPALFLGAAYQTRDSLSVSLAISFGFAGLILEAITWSTAAEGWKRYIERGRQILSGGK
jgi:hypothetical protein